MKMKQIKIVFINFIKITNHGGQKIHFFNLKINEIYGYSLISV